MVSTVGSVVLTSGEEVASVSDGVVSVSWVVVTSGCGIAVVPDSGSAVVSG